MLAVHAMQKNSDNKQELNESYDTQELRNMSNTQDYQILDQMSNTHEN